MSENQFSANINNLPISNRAKKIWAWITQQGSNELFIRQATLGWEFSCSIRTIGRALKELKEQGLLVDLNKRHENRCKIYKVKKLGLTSEAEWQWHCYSKTFGILFLPVFDGLEGRPTFAEIYQQVTWELEGVKDELQLYQQTFAGCWRVQAEMGL